MGGTNMIERHRWGRAFSDGWNVLLRKKAIFCPSSVVLLGHTIFFLGKTSPHTHLYTHNIIFYHRMTVAGVMRQYQIVGRHAANEEHPNPEAYRMIVFAPNPVIAKSKFWYYLHQFRKMKKTTGEILDCVELVEKNNRIVKNYGIWLRYNSRSGTHNMYREFRDVSLTGAVSQLYDEMAGRHRARPRSIQIIRTATVKAADLKRPNPMQFAAAKVKFPLAHRVSSGKRAQKALSARTFTTVRPTTYFG